MARNTILLAGLVVLMAVASVQSAKIFQTPVQFFDSEARYTSFARIVKKCPEMTTLLSNPASKVTVLMPFNKGVDMTLKALKITLSTVLNTPSLACDVAKFHVVNATGTLVNVPATGVVVNTLLPEQLLVAYNKCALGNLLGCNTLFNSVGCTATRCVKIGPINNLGTTQTGLSQVILIDKMLFPDTRPVTNAP